MSVLNQYFAKEVVDFLYKDDSFMSKLANKNDFLNGKQVHIPQYQNQITVVKNAAITLTKDADEAVEIDLTFTLDDYSMDKPLVVRDIEELQTSYDKMSAVFRNTAKQFAEFIADEILSILITDAEGKSTIIETTGALGVANGSDNLTAKKLITYADLLSAKKEMDSQNVGKDRICLIDSELFHELMTDEQVIKYINFGSQTAVEGSTPRLAGFNLMERSTVGDDGVDSRYAMCFVNNEIVVADETPQVYVSENDVTWLGNAVRLRSAVGAINPRQDGKNVVLIKQGV